MTSTSNDDRSAVKWTWDDNNVTRMKGWMVHDCSLYGTKVVAASTSIAAKGEAPQDIAARKDVQRRAEEGDPLCRRALAYVAMKRLTS